MFGSMTTEALKGEGRLGVASTQRVTTIRLQGSTCIQRRWRQ